MIMNKLQKMIQSSAIQLADYKIDSKSIGYDTAKALLEKWTENFKELPDVSNCLEKLIDHLYLITDQKIVDDVMTYIRKYIAENHNELFYAPFGNTNESSFRITASLNTCPNYKTSLKDLLQLIKQQGVKDPKIVFIDDYLNSGGQFSRIINDWFSSELNREEQILIKKCKLYFIFKFGMIKGEHKAQKIISENFINAQVLILERYDDDSGIFGNHHDVELIKAGLPVSKESDSIFRNVEAKELTDFFHIMYESGLQLIKQYKPDKGKFEERALGYGNSAKLHIGEYNMPTCTLSSLWLSGEVVLFGKKINWQSLFPRREKITQGSESDSNVSVSNQAKFSSILLHTENNEIPFEVRITIKLDKTIKAGQLFKNISIQRMNKLKDEIRQLFSEKAIEWLTLQDSELEQINMIFEGIAFDDSSHIIKASVSCIDLITFIKSQTYLSFRIRFYDLSLYEAMLFQNLAGKKVLNRINYKIKEGTDSINTFNFADFLIKKLQMNSICIDHIMMHSFLKLDLQTYEHSSLVNNVMSIMSERLSPDNSTNHSKTSWLSMDGYNTRISYNQSCSVCVCQAGTEYNDSWLINHFLNKYFLIYLMVCHFESLSGITNKQGFLSKIFRNNEEQKIIALYKSLKSHDICQSNSEYLNQYFHAVQKCFSKEN